MLKKQDYNGQARDRLQRNMGELAENQGKPPIDTRFSAWRGRLLAAFGFKNRLDSPILRKRFP
jgi:hypothetical protein